MRVSIVVNNHNYGVYVRAAVDSALSQDHPDTEVVVVDDGSTDGSQKLLEGYADTVCLILTENRGQSAAINTGFAAATGGAFIFLDADDELLPDAASRISAHFEGHPNAARIHARVMVIDQAGQPTGEILPELHRPLPSGDLRAAELAGPFDLPTVGTSANAFSRRALDEVMPIPVDRYGRVGADWYLVHVTTLVGDVIVEDRPTVHYRLHGANSFGTEVLDLNRTRIAITLESATLLSLAEVADRLGLSRPRRIVSMSNALSRITSLRFAPELHPLPGDSRRKVLIDAVIATGRRQDTGWPVRLGVAVWCVAIAVMPRRVAHHLVDLLLQPPERLKSLLRLLHGPHEGSNAAAA